MNHFNRPMMAALGRCFLALISVCVLESNLPAAPMVYTGTVVTDVRVGTTLLHNASVKITFEGDTNNISSVNVQSNECLEFGGSGWFLFIPSGVARMEIEFQGRTRRARLNDGQIFVTVDECNGGIGFGSFIGPNNPPLEPAYPLGLTIGTAEYAAITNFSPLTGPLSVTGSAWSCIGFPTLPTHGLPGSPNGNCTPPDAYPLKSDIGDIFIYQIEGGEVDNNHVGSRNRGAFLVRPQATSTLRASGAEESEIESGVVYTLQTVADGSIGTRMFYQALVTLRMISDTESVRSRPSPVDATKALYENRVGFATVTVDDGGTVTTAKFEPGEVYVRYDTGAGVAGFGSPISPTYPVALNCSNSAYPSEANYTVDCLQGEYDYRQGTLAQLNLFGPFAGLQPSLSQNTLLTGPAHTCAGPYTIDPSLLSSNDFPGDLRVCGGPAPRGLHTSKGDLFLQDQVGGSLSLGFADIVFDEAYSSPGWDLANSGFLHVEVLKDH